jgi:hypothetical protein
MVPDGSSFILVETLAGNKMVTSGAMGPGETFLRAMVTVACWPGATLRGVTDTTSSTVDSWNLFEPNESAAALPALLRASTAISKVRNGSRKRPRLRLRIWCEFIRYTVE